MMYAYAASSIGSMIASSIGSYLSAKGNKAMLNAQANIADINARMAENTAQSVLNQGKQQVAQSTMQYGALKSKQKTALAANGVDLGVGNAAEIQASTDIMKEVDANTIHANAVRAAWGYRAQASQYQIDAMTKRTQAGAISPGMSATTTLLTSASQAASNWYMLNKMGAFSNSPSNSSSNATTTPTIGGQTSGTEAWRSIWG